MQKAMSRFSTWVLIISSLLVGYMLMIWPLFAVLQPFRPQWALVIVLFWVYLKPDYVGVIFACITGLVLDLLLGTPLGTYGLLFTLFTYLLSIWMVHFRFCSISRQAFVIGLFVFVSILLRVWLMSMAKLPSVSLWYLVSAASSALVWPLLCFIFKMELNRLQLVDSWT